MKYLLDTHILLWAVSDSPELPSKAREILSDYENEIYYSLISLWEVEIKHIAHPDKLIIGAKELAEYCEESEFNRLNFDLSQLLQLHTLRRNENAAQHKDPFDRILICQAKAEDLIFLTHDHLLKDYGERCVLTINGRLRGNLRCK